MRLNIGDNKISLFSAGIKNTKPYRDITISNLALRVSTNARLKTLTQQLQRIEDHSQRQQFKGEKLPFVTFSGTFSTRSVKGLRQHSSFLCFDIDNLKNAEDIARVKNTLINIPYFSTVMMFTSPSGNGVKWITYIDLKRAEHKVWYDAIRNYLKKEYGIETDKTSDVSRVCYLSYDEDFYFNSNVYTDRLIMFPLDDYKSKMETRVKSSSQPTSVDYTNLVNLSKALVATHIDITEDYADWVKIGLALAGDYGENGRHLFHCISSINPNYKIEDCDRKYDSCLKNNDHSITCASIFYFAREKGVEIPEQEIIQINNIFY